MEHLRRLLERDSVHKAIENTAPKTVIPFPGTKQPCPICKGAGYTRRDVQPGHPEFGKAIACACKIVERKERLQRDLAELSGMISLDHFRNASFESFTFVLPGVGDAYRQARQFASCPLG